MINLDTMTPYWTNSFLNKTQAVTKAAADMTINVADRLGELAGHGVRYLQNLPSHMQQSKQAAVATFFCSNAVMFIAMYKITQLINRRIQLDSPQLDGDQIIVKNLLLDFNMAISTLTFNIVFTKVIHYPLSRLTMAVITVGTLILRRLLHKEPTLPTLPVVN